MLETQWYEKARHLLVSGVINRLTCLSSRVIFMESCMSIYSAQIPLMNTKAQRSYVGRVMICLA